MLLASLPGGEVTTITGMYNLLCKLYVQFIWVSTKNRYLQLFWKCTIYLGVYNLFVNLFGYV